MTDILPYSDRKALQASTPTWGIEEIVRAQRMACDGATLHDIAEALNREPREVLRVVEQDQPGSRKRRQTKAGVDHAQIKSRW